MACAALGRKEAAPLVPDSGGIDVKGCVSGDSPVDEDALAIVRVFVSTRLPAAPLYAGRGRGRVLADDG